MKNTRRGFLAALVGAPIAAKAAPALKALNIDFGFTPIARGNTYLTPQFIAPEMLQQLKSNLNFISVLDQHDEVVVGDRITLVDAQKIKADARRGDLIYIRKPPSVLS